MTDEGIVFIDGDLLKYKLASVGQEVSVEASVDDIPRGNFKNKTEAREYFEAEGLDYSNESYEVVIKPKPWPQVVSVARKMISNIVKKSGCKKFRIYVEAENTFRYDRAKIQEYKASPSRKAAKAPYYRDKVAEWLVEEMGAIVTEDIETDDYISIATSMGYYKGKKWVGATTDKDAKQTEGLLLNWDTMTEPTLIKPLDGAKALWKQMLTGDNIDNIRGCRGVAARSKLLTSIGECKSEIEMYLIVRAKYFEVAEKKGLAMTMDGEELDPIEEMRENLALLYMFRKKPKFDKEGNIILESDIKLDELEAQVQEVLDD